MELRFGRALKLVREARGYSQEDLEKVLSRGAIFMYEQDRRSPTLDTLVVLANFLDVSPATIVAAGLTETTADPDAFVEKLRRELAELGI